MWSPNRSAVVKRGSAQITETLYPRLLLGDDPRQILYEVRRQLFMTSNRDHDWASLVAYGSLPSNTDEFTDQVTNFFERQIRRAIEVSFERADNCDKKQVDEKQNAPEDVMQKKALEDVKLKLETWKQRLPTGESMEDRIRRANCYALYGTTYKRIAIITFNNNEKEQEANQAYEISWSNYKKAMNEMLIDDPKYYWMATQYLCLSAVKKDFKKDNDIYEFVYKLAMKDLNNVDKDTQAWAHSSLAELELLSLFHQPSKDEVSIEKIELNVCKHCNKVIELMGAESFHTQSTTRQFKRYMNHWKKVHPNWKKIALAAVNILSPNTTSTNEEFPTY